MAEIAYQPAQVLTITNPAKNLDPIDVIFLDHSPGRGRVIIRCYAQAWTAWWGAMGERHTVRTFFLSCDAQYLASKLIQGLSEKFLARKRDLQEVYLELICRAIQDALRAEVASPQAPAPQAVVSIDTLREMVGELKRGYEKAATISGSAFVDGDKKARHDAPAIYSLACEVLVILGYAANTANDWLTSAGQQPSAPSASPHQGADARWVDATTRLPEPYLDALVKRADGTQRAARLNRAGCWELATYKDANRHQYMASDVIAWLDVELGHQPHQGADALREDDLRRSVRAMTAMLQNGEWAEHVSKDRDAMALESAITELHNELHAAPEATNVIAELVRLKDIKDRISAIDGLDQVSAGNMHAVREGRHLKAEYARCKAVAWDAARAALAQHQAPQQGEPK